MADANTESLFLQVDASVELLRRNLAAGEQPLSRFEQRAAKMAASVDASISSMGGRFGAFATMAESAAQKAERSFNESFTAIQRMAATAIAAPTVQGGGLNLGAGDARAAAEAAQQQARAIGLIEQAAIRAAAGQGELTRETRLTLAANQAARIEAERYAAELLREAGALERLEIEAKAAGVGLMTLDRGHVAVGASAGQQRQSTMMLGQQVQDFAVQVSNGGNVMTAFSQQIGQASFAVQGMGGKMAGVAAFLGSGWGAAVLVAVTVLAPLVGKLLEGNDALDNAVKKLKDDADATDVSRKAREIFTKTLEGQTVALDEQNKALERNITSQRQLNQQALAGARQQLVADQTTLQREEKAAAAARRDATALRNRVINPDATTDPESMASLISLAAAADRKATELEKRVAKAQSNIAKAQAGIRAAQVPIAIDEAQAAVNPIAAINKKYDEQKDKAIAAAAANDKLTASLTARLTVIERMRAAELKTQQAAASASRKVTSPGDAARTAQGSSLLSSAERYRGLDENRDNASLRDLFSKAGMSVDPKMLAWCAAFVNAVLATNGLPGTGSLNARSFLNYGTSTSAPVKGDLVVSRRGTGQQGHVGFYEGRDAKGNVLVLGGNTGNKVGVQRVAPTDVLGFRRPPSASAIERDGTRGRIAALKDDTAYSEQERQARHRLLDAMRRTATSEEQRDTLIREDINAESDATKRKLENQLAAGDLNDAEAKHLLEVNESTRRQHLLNVTIARAAVQVNNQFEAASQDRQSSIARLQIQSDLATTLKERRRIALEILELEQQERRAALDRVMKDPNASANDVQLAKDGLARLPAQETAERGQVERNNASPMDDFKARLHRDVDDLNEAFEKVEANGLQSLEDGLVGLINGTESVGSAFKKMANQIIADLARIAIQKAVLAIFNSFGGGGIPGFGSISFAEGRVPGYAGGVISGPGTGTSDSILALLGGKPIRVSNGESIMTAAATRLYGPTLKAMNSNSLPGFASGLVPTLLSAYPRLPASDRMQSSGAMSVSVPISIDATGADPAGLARVQQELSQLRANLPGQIVATVQDANQRRLIR